MISFIAIGISIILLWFVVRFNYFRQGAIFENSHISEKLKKDVDDLMVNRKIERKAKIITTIVLLILGMIIYNYDEKSLALVYVLSIGWLLFCLINLEVSTIYKVIDNREKSREETQQYIMNKFREIKK